jgi:hypothetical protein
MMAVEPVIAASARRHQITDKITDDDMLHAHRNHVDAFDLDDGMTMLDVIVHAMPARTKFLR